MLTREVFSRGAYILERKTKMARREAHLGALHSGEELHVGHVSFQ